MVNLYTNNETNGEAVANIDIDVCLALASYLCGPVGLTVETAYYFANLIYMKNNNGTTLATALGNSLEANMPGFDMPPGTGNIPPP